ncbi:hypothetical protein D9619_013745 [Psilocybe cf. subviscida]|uniref:Programmed cell death protein 2 C-terminal domain-containing protein n=1 Tax=Psilocybe cf. subviscida TaxID=2480587 RepID=A0A8H5AYR5_9AGAR|nr:hypothetical protein D9619_013745 [Psilocybe cf. subviscida]
MAPSQTDDDRSDSDSDDRLSQVEMPLGVSDGAVDTEADRIDAVVSCISGPSVLLPSREPPFESSHCKSCAQPMGLLVQMWCPFEDSPMDRALFIWGCTRAGSYAQKLAKKRKRQDQREWDRTKASEERARQEQQRKEMFKSGGRNPFAGERGESTVIYWALTCAFDVDGHKNRLDMPTFGAGFGISAQIFGGTPTTVKPGSSSTENGKNDPKSASKSHAEEDKYQDDNDDASDSEAGKDEDEELLTALAATSITDSAWNAAPSYLSTTSENALVDDDKGKKGKGGDGVESWAKEAYENSIDVDQVFERFMKRVGYEGEQCVQSDPLPVTKPAFKVVHPQRRVYDPSGVAKCARCGGRWVFECQLMPNLINVLHAPESEGKDGENGKKSAKKMTDEERRAAVERALKGQDKDARGMEWGTCMVFSCEKDCCVEGGKEAKEVWREEVVLVQWDT